MYDAALESGKAIKYNPDSKRGQWIQVIKGKVKVNGKGLNEGDGAAIEKESMLLLEAEKETELILLDLG